MLLPVKKTNEENQREPNASENTYLIAAGIALVNGNDRVYTESVSHLSEPRRKLLNCEIHDLTQLNSDLSKLLHLTLHAAVAKSEK